jgi:type II secretory pathway component PulJ
MEFLNSSVGMWLLSSVVLTGGAAVIQQVQHQYQISEQNHQQLVTHLFEIQNRLDNMEYLLRRAQTVGDAQEALHGLFKSIFPLSPELQNRSLGSLYFTVYNLIPGSRQQKAQEAIQFVRELEDSEWALQSRPSNQPLTEADRAQFNKLIKSCKAIHTAIDIQRSR